MRGQLRMKTSKNLKTAKNKGPITPPLTPLNGELENDQWLHLWWAYYNNFNFIMVL